MFVKDLIKKYDGKTVVDSVSFQLPEKSVISMIGPNGAGKSTVLNILSRLIARDSGVVDFQGTDITKWKSRELSKRLAILTQQNNIQMKLTVRELVAFGRFPYSGSRITPEDDAVIDRAISYMELDDFRDRFIDELSGGQRQRAYIAMVIAQDTEYVLLHSSETGNAHGDRDLSGRKGDGAEHYERRSPADSGIYQAYFTGIPGWNVRKCDRSSCYDHLPDCVWGSVSVGTEYCQY